MPRLFLAFEGEGVFVEPVVVVPLVGATAGGCAGVGAGWGFLRCWGKGFFGRGSCFFAIPVCKNCTRTVPTIPVPRIMTIRGSLVVWP